MSGAKRRHTQRLASGQHLLRSPLADELADAAGIADHELVVEIGAGTGRLTAPLAERAGHVIAIEVDLRLARLLRRRFQGDGRVTVVEADGLTAALPACPFRVAANLPFAITTPMLRRLLDDPGLPLLAADLVVQRGFAVKRCSPRPCTLLSAGWLPWWQLTVERVLPPGCFQPPPSVESAILSARRRPRPLVDAVAHINGGCGDGIPARQPAGAAGAGPGAETLGSVLTAARAGRRRAADAARRLGLDGAARVPAAVQCVPAAGGACMMRRWPT